MNDAARILADLDNHAGLFDLAGELGDALLDVAESDVAASFDAESAPSGEPWPELTTDYGRWKAANYPGRPIGVLTGYLRDNLFAPGELTAEKATLPIGATPEAEALAGYLNDGADNRRARPFVGLSEQGIDASDAVCQRRLDGGFAE